MKKILVALSEVGDHTRRVRDAISLVNSAQNYFRLELAEEAFSLNSEVDEIHSEDAFLRIRDRWGEQRIICVAAHPFDDNWFSHENRNCAIITMADWEEVFAPPSLRAYLLYQFAQSLLALESDLSEDMLLRVVHEPPVGCLSDLCSNKSDIKLGMVAGNLCLKCEGILLQFGVDSEAINAARRIAALVREEAIGRPKIIDPQSAFIVMRFSTNDENDNAYKYGVKPGLTEAGLTVQRADDKVTSTQILDKVFHLIGRSRFIVAKVDEENLNVFFELGAAMGLSKDVLLISESSLVLKLPSDLRTWECLTYDRGNYAQLSERISRFYRDNFGLPAKPLK